MPTLPSSPRSAYLTPLSRLGRVAEVEQRLIDAIHAGVLADGDPLPSEADLATQLGVATMTVREALAGLRRAGLVETRRGRNGGSFVNAPASRTRARLLARLDAMTVDELRDLGDHRRAIAAGVAELAAGRASQTDLRRLEQLLDDLETATTPAGRRAADARFHAELAATTRSLRLTRAESDAGKLLGSLLWLTVDGQAERVRAEHRAIMEAVANRDAALARDRMAAHVDADTQSLVAAHLARVPAGDRPVLPVVRRALDDVFGEIERLRAVALTLPDRPVLGDLEPLRRHALGLLERRELIAGTGVVFAPGVLADAERWLAWWRRDPAGALVPLEPTLDPEDVDFYDYEHAEWYTTPRDSGRRWIAGPFVDHAGTDEHILTFTVSIERDGRFLGVAGADVAVGDIEAIAGPALRALGRPAALANHRGRIIATADSGLLVGTLWPGARRRWPPAARAVVESDPALEWLVVAGP